MNRDNFKHLSTSVLRKQLALRAAQAPSFEVGGTYLFLSSPCDLSLMQMQIPKCQWTVTHDHGHVYLHPLVRVEKQSNEKVHLKLMADDNETDGISCNAWLFNKLLNELQALSQGQSTDNQEALAQFIALARRLTASAA